MYTLVYGVPSLVCNYFLTDCRRGLRDDMAAVIAAIGLDFKAKRYLKSMRAQNVPVLSV